MLLAFPLSATPPLGRRRPVPACPPLLPQLDRAFRHGDQGVEQQLERPAEGDGDVGAGGEGAPEEGEDRADQRPDIAADRSRATGRDHGSRSRHCLRAGDKRRGR